MRRNRMLFQAICGTTAMLGFTEASRADFSYNFDGLSTGALIGSSPATGTVGQDNWVMASGVTPIVHNEPVTGFSGNYITSTPAIPANGQDSISTRVGSNLGLNSSGFATFQFDGLLGPGYQNASNNTVYRRRKSRPALMPTTTATSVAHRRPRKTAKSGFSLVMSQPTPAGLFADCVLEHRFITAWRHRAVFGGCS